MPLKEQTLLTPLGFKIVSGLLVVIAAVAGFLASQVIDNTKDMAHVKARMEAIELGFGAIDLNVMNHLQRVDIHDPALTGLRQRAKTLENRTDKLEEELKEFKRDVYTFIVSGGSKPFP